MVIFLDGVVAFLAAVGLTALLWLLAGALTKRKEMPLPAAVVLPVSGEAEEMEAAVRLARAAARQLGETAPVLLADCGLHEEAIRRARLLEKSGRVELLRQSELADYFTEEKEVSVWVSGAQWKVP